MTNEYCPLITVKEKTDNSPAEYMQLLSATNYITHLEQRLRSFKQELWFDKLLILDELI